MHVPLWEGDGDLVLPELCDDLLVQVGDHRRHGEDPTTPEVQFEDHGTVAEL